MTLGLSSALDLLTAPFIHEGVTRRTRHRPWPVPSGSWLMAQTWVDLLFAHWPVDAEALRSALPPQLEIDQFDGRAWVGITPFEVRHLRLRPMLPLPVVSSFPEINVRTYVIYRGRPGIYFFSIRIDDGGPPAAFRALYRRLDPVDPAPGSLERWLTERYCLYTLDGNQRVLRGDIHHPPWQLHAAEAKLELNTMGDEVALPLEEPLLLHYSARQDVVFWGLQAADV